MRKSLLARLVAAIFVALMFASCDSVDNKRIPLVNVNLTFWSIADWEHCGVGGAGQSRRFIRELKIPANYPYTALTYTGFGGILLCTTYIGDNVAYDLSCPVECRYDVRVSVNDDGYAKCAKCHSCYDIFELHGHPISGEAAHKGYGLKTYTVSPGRNGEYMVVY